jgi:histidyl-tRNA synthetase
MKLLNAKGTRDFPPEEKILRQTVTDKLRLIFERYGYNPLETPVIERLDIMTAKYGAGEDSDASKEIFKFQDQGDRKVGLRFEFTFALARFIGMNPTMKLPFKRYQMGPVFRDGPIKLGRYREFWQCDVDTVGVRAVSADSEILAMVKDVFKELDFEVTIELNNRKVLEGILEFANVKKEDQESALISIDKLKKIGTAGVQKELEERGIDDEQIAKLLGILSSTGTNQEILENFKQFLTNDIAKEGIQEMEDMFNYLDAYKVNYQFTPSLARGLAYYTGPIFEVFLKDSKIKGSVAGGGRWDKMIQNYLGSKQEYPATGIAFGLEPITEALKLKNSELKKSVTQAFIIPIQTETECIEIANKLRNKGINTELALTKRGLSKNLQYINTMQIPFAIIVGPDELKEKKVKLRDMKTGEESLLTIPETIKRIK